MLTSIHPGSIYLLKVNNRNTRVRFEIWPNLTIATLRISVPFYSMLSSTHPSSLYLLKVNDRNIRVKCEIWPKLTIETSERLHWHCLGVFIVNFEHISHL